MKTALAAMIAAALAGPAVADTAPAGSSPADAAPAAGSVFEDLAAFGYDLDKFRPLYTGRLPYRQGSGS